MSIKPRDAYPIHHMIDQLTGGPDELHMDEVERALYRLLVAQGAFMKITLADISREVHAERAKT